MQCILLVLHRIAIEPVLDCMIIVTETNPLDHVTSGHHTFLMLYTVTLGINLKT